MDPKTKALNTFIEKVTKLERELDLATEAGAPQKKLDAIQRKLENLQKAWDKRWGASGDEL